MPLHNMQQAPLKTIDSCKEDFELKSYVFGTFFIGGPW